MNDKLFDLPEVEPTTSLSQCCNRCYKSYATEVPTKMWEQYKDSSEDIQYFFNPKEWHWSDREIVLQYKRMSTGGAFHYYLCPMCMCKMGLAEPSELKRGMGPPPPPPAS